MKNADINEALKSLWVLVKESTPIVIGSQALHGTYPDLADKVMYSREVDVILPNKSRMGHWLSEVVGDDTPFAVDRGYYIDHVLPQDGLPIFAKGWEERLISRTLLIDGEPEVTAKYLALEDMAICKLGAGRPKDFAFIGALVREGYLNIDAVQRLIPTVPSAHREKVHSNMEVLRTQLASQVSRSTASEESPAVDASNAASQGPTASEGLFCGEVLAISVEGFITQKVNRDGRTVVHDAKVISGAVAVGDVVDIEYRDGLGVVQNRARDRGPQR